MAAFIAGSVAFPGLVRSNASRVSVAPVTSPVGKFANVQKRLRRRKRNESSRPRIPVQMVDDSPPINAPSGFLLLLSCVLAIATVGCVFELTGGHPTYGSTVTSAILAVSLPGFLFFFYSAVKKGQLEAMDDS